METRQNCLASCCRGQQFPAALYYVLIVCFLKRQGIHERVAVSKRLGRVTDIAKLPLAGDAKPNASKPIDADVEIQLAH